MPFLYVRWRTALNLRRMNCTSLTLRRNRIPNIREAES